MNKEIMLCGRLYCYELQRKKVKNLNLRIKPDGSIYVSAPGNVSVLRIESFLKTNELKISQMAERVKSRNAEIPAPEEFKDGESFLYLGEVKRIRVLEGMKNLSELKDGVLYLYLRDKSREGAAEKLFESWLRSESERILREICREYYPAFCPPLKEFPEIHMRRMRSRWGSCTPKKNLLCFNSCLACLPPECIEYVAAHEFTHFIHPNHSAAFYGELSRFMPDQRLREKRLRDFSQLPARLYKN